MDTLKSIRDEKMFDLFWAKVSSTAEPLDDVEEPQLPCRRKIPKRFDDGTSGHFHSTSKVYYC